jgi:hypothetical protein
VDEQWMDVGELPPIPLEEEGKGAQSLVIRTGRPLLLNDYQAQQRTAANVYYVDAASGTVSPETPEEDDERVRSALIVPLTVGGEVRGAIQVTSCRRDAFTQDQLQLLDALGAHIASAVQNATLYRRVQEEMRERERAEEALARSTAQLRRQVHDTVQSMGAIVGMRDPCPAAHERRVTSLALAIAGDVHDIGKVGVPAEIVAQHHERLDGSGYPAGRRGDQIMLEARIIAVSDVVGATASHRPYRPRLGLDHALAEVPSGAGTRHDEAVVVAREQVFANGYALVE